MSLNACSFCNKHLSEVRLLIKADPPDVPLRVMIWDECVSLSVEIILEETCDE